MYDWQKVDDKHFELLLEYIQPLKGETLSLLPVRTVHTVRTACIYHCPHFLVGAALEQTKKEANNRLSQSAADSENSDLTRIAYRATQLLQIVD